MPSSSLLVRTLAAASCAGSLFAQGTPSSPLAAAAGWRADQIHQSDGGVWYAHIDKVVDAYGANEVIAADDKGRLLLLSVYSGQWTANVVVCDGLWLAPTRSANVDPRVPGSEIYAAGRAGSIHRAILVPQPFAKFRLESIEIGHVAGEEFHAVVAADLVPGGGAELLVFGITGAVFQLTADEHGDTFTTEKATTVPGRVRDVAVTQDAAGARVMYGASRSGDLLRMTLGPDGLRHEVVLHEECGLGRVAIPKGRAGVIYTTRDDGVVVRAAVGDGGKVERSAIFAGGQGLRGIAAGRFFADDREAIACYGYDQTVHVVSRGADDAWTAEVVFTSVQKGHWLAVGELDGRNGTDELVATGFDGQIVLLSRGAGYALPGAAVAPGERAVVPPSAPATVRGNRAVAN